VTTVATRFTGSVLFTVWGLPSNVNYTFSPNALAGSGTSTLTISPTANATPGTYTVTVKTSASGTVTTNNLQLTIS
jgi:hypothetical protein